MIATVRRAGAALGVCIAVGGCTDEQLQNLSRAGAIMSAGSTPPPTTAPLSTSGTAYLRDQRVAGANRLCIYDRMGSPYVLTIDAATSCAVTLP